jgi:Fe(3+) dicitrate transport protein
MNFFILQNNFTMRAITLLTLIVISNPMINIAIAGANSGEGSYNSNIYGRVLHNGEGVPFVTVYLKGTYLGTSTDAGGYFMLVNLPAGEHIVVIQGIGYKNSEKMITVANGETTELVFNLEQDILMMEQVVVSGSRIGMLRYLPGSAAVVTGSQLKAVAPLTGNEVLRTIAGIHVVDEEGAGLRTNIGVRGLDPDRSRAVLVLEDGIPVALGPYGEPEMYYTPSIDRMAGIEVLKGSGSILFGPQTIGGVINYITADPPAESSGIASFSGGQGSHYTGQLGYGNTYGNTGFIVNYLRRQATNLGPTEFALNDFNGKFRFNSSPRSEIMVKLGIYDEGSNSTYVGITQYMYDAGIYDYSRVVPDDHLAVRRYSLGISHNFMASDNFRFTTTAFAYTTTRNWRRQDFTHNPEASNLTGISWGNGDIPGGGLYLRNSTGNRNRQFEVAGIETRFNYRYAWAGMNNMLDWGGRLLYERAYEQRVNGSDAGAISGDLRDEEIRTGHAVSSWAQNKLFVSDRLSFTTGLRAEFIEYERNILRSNFTDVSIMNNTRVAELIPGMGANYNFNDQTGLFAGIHRGFAPPRIKDAIGSDGTDLQLDAEKSWNYEIGMRAGLSTVAAFEMTFFRMDFSNQVIPVSESSGGAGTGYINGGRTMHHGVEGDLIIYISEFTGMRDNLILGMNSTLSRSVFAGDRYVKQCSHQNGEGMEETWINVNGNHTPYSPGVLASGFIQYEGAGGYGFRLGGTFTGRQYTDVLNTGNVTEWFEHAGNNPGHNYVQATASGQIGMLPSVYIMNASAWYNLGSGIRLNMTVKNIFNERYITTRRPQGIRVGLPRMVSAGVSYNF